MLRVAVEHDYNRDGVCSSLKFIPTDKTRTLLDNAGLICKKESGGIRILYDKDLLDALEMHALESLSLDFRVFSLDPDFNNYTEPFAADVDGIFCFDNRTVEGAGKHRLPPLGYFSFEDLRESYLKQRRESELREALRRGELSDWEQEEYSEILNLGDQHLREINGILPQSDHLSPPEFVLRIFVEAGQVALLRKPLRKPLREGRDESPEPTVYVIKFDSKKRYWKYYLTGQLVSTGKTSDDFEITAYTEDKTASAEQDKLPEFRAVKEPEPLSDRRLAYTFRSSARIPCRERYSFLVELKQKDESRKNRGIKNLPVASSKLVGLDTVDEEPEVVSEIYINS